MAKNIDNYDTETEELGDKVQDLDKKLDSVKDELVTNMDTKLAELYESI